MRHTAGRAVGELRQLLIGLVMGLPGPVVLWLTLLSVPASVAGGLGVLIFGATTWLTRRLAQLQRRRAAVPLPEPLTSPYVPLPTGLLARTGALIKDRATWRDLAWSVCQFVLGIGGVVVGVGLWLAAGECLSAPLLRVLVPANTGFDPAVLEIVGRSGPLTWLLVPLGVGLVVVAYRVPCHLLAVQVGLARWLLAPTATARLFARVDQLTTTRAAAVDASTVELRRVERDLHDGAQVRLVTLAMNLGMAEDVIDTDPAVAKDLLAQARASATTALTELRDLVHGICPPVLAERGLADAVRNLVLSSGIPVDLDLDPRAEGRLAAPVESAAYFVVAESLANAVRHSGAHRIQIKLMHNGGALHITVRDDGHGGADPAQGSGLRGIRRRLAAFDGTLRITSPPGGPTLLHMEVPCAC